MKLKKQCVICVPEKIMEQVFMQRKYGETNFETLQRIMGAPAIPIPSTPEPVIKPMEPIVKPVEPAMDLDQYFFEAFNAYLKFRSEECTRLGYLTHQPHKWIEWGLENQSKFLTAYHIEHGHPEFGDARRIEYIPKPPTPI